MVLKSYQVIIAFLMMLTGCRMQNRSEDISLIRVNQVGYQTSGIKTAVIVSPQDSLFFVIDEAGDIVFDDVVPASKEWDKSGETAALIDFSGLKTSGTYTIVCGSITSDPFKVENGVYDNLVSASIKAYYYHRASTVLEKEYAGLYERPLAHPDHKVLVHTSAASSERPVGSMIQSPGGWYDAGDYNKYIVNSAISVYTMMTAYKHFYVLLDELDLNIEESGNQVPDILDEVKWNLDWMLTMQDPNDGGVYHKLTTASFESFVRPEEATNDRFVVRKSTAATLDFASVMANASRIYADFDPVWAASALVAAQKAWTWAIEHPDNLYKNPDKSDPEIRTGEYGDLDVSDEFFWAAAELFTVTGDENYRQYLQKIDLDAIRVPSWSNVAFLGLMTLAESQSEDELILHAQRRILDLGKQQLNEASISPYGIPLNLFRWGSNGDLLNQSMVMLQAWRLSDQPEYIKYVQSSLDYILGKNATGYCFVTGFGQKSPQNIHDRLSATDDVDEPVPGWLAGGPNPYNRSQDCGESMYPTDLPAKCYLDELCSYSTNEIAINWNAPLIYVASAIKVIQEEQGINLR